MTGVQSLEHPHTTQAPRTYPHIVHTIIINNNDNNIKILLPRSEGYRFAPPSLKLAVHFMLYPSECPIPDFINATPTSCFQVLNT